MLRIAIGRSSRLTWILSLAHGTALAVLVPLDLPSWVKALTAIAILASLVYSLTHAALLTARNAVIALEIKEAGAISIRTRRGSWRDCRLAGGSYVSSWLTILLLTEDDRWSTRCVVIMPDNIDAEDFRRLRVRLRWGGTRSVT